MSVTAALLANDHGAVDRILARLRASLDGGDALATYAALDLFWARLAVHIRAEHLHLFPAVLARIKCSSTEAESIVQELRADHDFFMHELAEAVANARELLTIKDPLVVRDSLNEISKVLGAIEDRLRRHNETEERTVYRWVSLISDQEQTELADQIKKELANNPPRFADDVWKGAS